MNTNKKLLYALVCAVSLQAVVPVHASMWTNVSAWWHNVPAQSKYAAGIVVAGLLTACGLYALWNRPETKKAPSYAKPFDQRSGLKAADRGVSARVVAPAPLPVANPRHELFVPESSSQVAQPVLEVQPVVVVQQQHKEIQQEVSVVPAASEPLLRQGYETVCHGTPGQAAFVGSPDYVALRKEIDQANFTGQLKEVHRDIFGNEDVCPNLCFAERALVEVEKQVVLFNKRISVLHLLSSLEVKKGVKPSITASEYKILKDDMEGVQKELVKAKEAYTRELRDQAYEDTVVDEIKADYDYVLEKNKTAVEQPKSKTAERNKKKREKAKERKQKQERN